MTKPNDQAKPAPPKRTPEQQAKIDAYMKQIGKALTDGLNKGAKESK